MIPRKVTLLRVHQKEIRADKEFIRLSALALQAIYWVNEGNVFNFDQIFDLLNVDIFS